MWVYSFPYQHKMKLNIYPLLAISIILVLGSCFGGGEENSVDAQLKRDISAIDSYLSANNIETIKDVNGVRFTVDSLGKGYAPRLSDHVTFDYSLRLLDGNFFQTSTLSKAFIENLIIGFQIALPLLPNGSKATLYIPSGYAYGAQGQSQIPANSNLVFKIKLKAIVVTAAEKNQWAADTLALSRFIKSAAITNVKKDTSGLRYVITQAGSGSTPTIFHKVKISYTGYLISNDAKGEKFYVGANEPLSNYDSRVGNYIRGFQVGLQKMQKGSKAILYMPSGLAFGSKMVPGGLVQIPANSNVIYEIELIDILNP